MDRCPYHHPLHILSRKWSFFVLRSLRKQKRFSELKTELHFITNRILTQELRRLETEDLITHSDGHYVIAPAGRSLLEAAMPLAQWGVKRGCRDCHEEWDCVECIAYKPSLECCCKDCPKDCPSRLLAIKAQH